MLKGMALLMGVLISATAWADINLEPLLNKITLQFSAYQWVTTQTALVNIVINAAVTDKAIENVQNKVILKLNQLARADWHILSFNRQQDNSGLEKIQITAQARLPQTELANLRNKAKAITQPGESYAIDSVQFTPSDEEFRQANIVLRNTIYQQVKAEIENLNKVYPEQKYFLHQLDFSGANNPMPMMQTMMKDAALVASAPRPMNVGNKAEMTANAVIASMPVPVPPALQN